MAVGVSVGVKASLDADVLWFSVGIFVLEFLFVLVRVTELLAFFLFFCFCNASCQRFWFFTSSDPS